MEPFEDDLFTMVENIKFIKINNAFQNTLRSDIQKINASSKVFTFSDKSRNIYQLEKQQYEKILRENITSKYKLAPVDSVSNINRELKLIASRLGIGDRLETMNKTNAFITLKDHKENFENNPKCRLINSAKSQLGIVSKQILDKINSIVRQHTRARQWRNSSAVIDWFNSLSNKQCLSFIMFDIVDFYPSISANLLLQAQSYAKKFVSIPEEDIQVIMHTRKSLLFDNNKVWCKRDNTDLFDVTMGSHDGAEVCELVGLLILDKLQSVFKNENIGLYRDDGLAAF